MSQTVNSLYRFISHEFKNKGICDSELESKHILIKALDLSYTDFLLNLSSQISEDKAEYALDLMAQRLEGRPIQYIVGEWDFLDYSFKVGEGVLIPRPETELLCEKAFDFIKDKKKPVIFDLCSGSGCIGISIKMLLPQSKVFLIEKSPTAFEYTKMNSENICGENDNTLLNKDILDFASFDDLPQADIILSNPPYIRSDEIPALQSEVLKEPIMALDGGEDGLIFYRAIAEFWIDKLKNDGIVLLECGEDQASDIIDIFSAKGLLAESIKDFNNIERIIVVRRTK